MFGTPEQLSLMSDCSPPNPIPSFLALPIGARKEWTNFHRLLADYPSKLSSLHTALPSSTESGRPL